MTRPGFLAIDRITHAASISGRVSDGSNPLAGAEVVITDGPAAWKSRVAALLRGGPNARPDRTISDLDGFFGWIDLPAGIYQLKASLAGDRYATATASATVGPTLATVDVVLAPTTLTGKVSANVPAGPLAMARVRLVDSGESTYTSSGGTFTISPVEPGNNRTVEVSAPRYITATAQVTLQQGQSTTSAITLTHS